MKTYTFKYNIGDKVTVSNPLDDVAIKVVVTQQIKPFEYPEGNFGYNPNNLLLYPTTRKDRRPTRSISYLTNLECTEVYMWATEKCLRLMEG